MSLSFMLLLPSVYLSFARNVTLTPSNPSQHGVSALIVSYNISDNTHWLLYSDDNTDLYMELSINHSCGFHPYIPSNISILINSTNERPLQDTYISLSFIINNTTYFSAEIHLHYIYLQCSSNIIESYITIHSYLFIFTIHNDPASNTSSLIYTNPSIDHTVSCIYQHSLPTHKGVNMRINYTSSHNNHSTLNIHSFNVQYPSAASPITTALIDRQDKSVISHQTDAFIAFTQEAFWIIVGGLFLICISIFIAGYLTAFLFHNLNTERNTHHNKRKKSLSITNDIDSEANAVKAQTKHVQLPLPQYSHLQSLSYNRSDEAHVIIDPYAVPHMTQSSDMKMNMSCLEEYPYMEHSKIKAVALLQDAAMIARVMEDEDAVSKFVEQETVETPDDDVVLIYGDIKWKDEMMDRITNDVSLAHKDEEVVASDSEDGDVFTPFAGNMDAFKLKKMASLPVITSPNVSPNISPILRSYRYKSEGISADMAQNEIDPKVSVFSYRSEGIMTKDVFNDNFEFDNNIKNNDNDNMNQHLIKRDKDESKEIVKVIKNDNGKEKMKDNMELSVKEKANLFNSFNEKKIIKNIKNDQNLKKQKYGKKKKVFNKLSRVQRIAMQYDSHEAK